MYYSQIYHGDGYSQQPFNYYTESPIPPENGPVNADLSASWPQGTPSNVGRGINDTQQFLYKGPPSSEAPTGSGIRSQVPRHYEFHNETAKTVTNYHRDQIKKGAQIPVDGQNTAHQGQSRKRLRESDDYGENNHTEKWECPKCHTRMASGSEQMNWHFRQCNFCRISKEGDTAFPYDYSIDQETTDFRPQSFPQPVSELGFYPLPHQTYQSFSNSSASAQGFGAHYESSAQTYIENGSVSDGQYAYSSTSTPLVPSPFDTPSYITDIIAQHPANSSDTFLSGEAIRESNVQSLPSSLNFSVENNTQSCQSTPISVSQPVPAKLVCTYPQKITADGPREPCSLSFVSKQELKKHVVDYHLHSCHCFEWRDNKRQKCLEGPFASTAALRKHVNRHLDKVLPEKN